MTFWDKATLFPPCLIRLLARHPYGQPLSEDEISERMKHYSAGDGYSFNSWAVALLSKETAWTGVRCATMFAFIQACGCDFEDRKVFNRMRTYLRGKPKWRHLRKHPDWEKVYKPIVKAYYSTLKDHAV